MKASSATTATFAAIALASFAPTMALASMAVSAPSKNAHPSAFNQLVMGLGQEKDIFKLTCSKQWRNVVQNVEITINAAKPSIEWTGTSEGANGSVNFDFAESGILPAAGSILQWEPILTSTIGHIGSLNISLFAKAEGDLVNSVFSSVVFPDPSSHDKVILSGFSVNSSSTGFEDLVCSLVIEK